MHINIGIDWSEGSHQVAFVNEEGARVQEFEMSHSESGFGKIEAHLQQLNLSPEQCIIGIETAHTLLIDYLWAKGYSHLYVLPPNVVNSSRGRYRQSGAKNDQWDAYLIANLVRTDRHRFVPWQPGSDLLQQMRAAVHYHLHLTKVSVATTNRLRSVLLRYYPAAYHLFPTWPTLAVCHFIKAYPRPAQAAALSPEEFQEFLRRIRHPRRGYWAKYYERLKGDYAPSADGPTAAYQREGSQLARFLLTFLKAKEENLTYLQSCFVHHPDAEIFRSLPGAATFLAPALLVKFGEERERFPSAASVQALAGTCPVTKQSGRSWSIRFRRACDREFRHIAQLHARASLAKAGWTSAYYHSILERNPSENHALRCLANRWLKIIWTLWQQRICYDESIHLQNVYRNRTIDSLD